LIEPVREPDEGLNMYEDRHRPFQKFEGEYLLATVTIAS
jgi:hypothetical protein